jgi:Flp pilus assembly protein TadG
MEACAMRYADRIERRVARLRQRLRRFTGNSAGSTAVEFAIVAAPFMFMMMSLFEIALLYLTQASLDFALAEAQRLVRTGQVQTGGISQAEYYTRVCDRMRAYMPVTCAGNLTVDVDSFPDFGSVGNLNPLNAAGQIDQTRVGFAPGTANQVVLVRAYFEAEIFTPGFRQVFANLPGGKRLLSSTALFRTEPYPT